MERRSLLRNILGSGMLAGLAGLGNAGEPGSKKSAGAPQGQPAQKGEAELIRRIAELEARGGGTLELNDGVYEVARPLRLPTAVSLVMTPNAVIRARKDFQGDAVIVKGGGRPSQYTHTGGWIRGGVIDGNSQALTGLRVEGGVSRIEIADLVVLNATHKGMHLLKGGYETNLTRVRCDVDKDLHYAPGSIGIHYERGDSKVNLAHVIGYETGVRSDGGSNWFTMIHTWNWEPTQGPMPYCFYCNGTNNTFNQCYADSPTVAGFYMTKPHQSVVQCRVYFSRWAKDNTGAGFLITSQGRHGSYLANVLFADRKHRLAKAFDGDLGGACILGTSSWGVMGGLENQIPSGEPGHPAAAPPAQGPIEHPPLNLAGSGVRLPRQTESPRPDEGELGEVRWVEEGQDSALWVKTSRGWKKSRLT